MTVCYHGDVCDKRPGKWDQSHRNENTKLQHTHSIAIITVIIIVKMCSLNKAGIVSPVPNTIKLQKSPFHFTITKF